MNRWKEQYANKLTSADQAARLLVDGDNILTPLANGQPLAFMNAVGKRIAAGDLKDCLYLTAVDVRWFDIYHPDLAGKVVIDSGFVGPVVRDLVGKGVYTYTPARLGDIVDIVSHHRNFAIAAAMVSPMDEHGFFSTGVDVDICWEPAKTGLVKNIIVEVNENMPRTFGTNHFHISEVKAVIENHVPLVELPNIPPDEKDKVIGNYIAELIEDGSCIQLGIGGIPNAIAHCLMDKKDLGVHSEMLTDSMVDLYYAGVITCARKNFMPYKWIGSFALGSKKLYDFVHNNPLVEMHSAHFVNNPRIISKNDNMVSVNSTLEVDLPGNALPNPWLSNSIREPAGSWILFRGLTVPGAGNPS
jgi:acyl-CoA hydrolase